jgi:hypothetical protein
MTRSHLKTVPIASEVVFFGAIVIAEYLLVQIAEQVERFDIYVGPLESALGQASEVFQPVRVNLPINETNRRHA